MRGGNLGNSVGRVLGMGQLHPGPFPVHNIVSTSLCGTMSPRARRPQRMIAAFSPRSALLLAVRSLLTIYSVVAYNPYVSGSIPSTIAKLTALTYLCVARHYSACLLSRWRVVHTRGMAGDCSTHSYTLHLIFPLDKRCAGACTTTKLWAAQFQAR